MPALAPPCAPPCSPAGSSTRTARHDARPRGVGLHRLRRPRQSPCAAAASAPDGPSPAVLNAEFGVPNAVEVQFGVAGMLRVRLQHRNGSCAGVYLHGANVTSWRISNGSEVLFLRPDTPLDGSQPISGGVPVCWPQAGPGGASLGSVGEEGKPPLPKHGFAQSMTWDIAATGMTKDRGEPFVRLRLRDSAASRALWDHAFQLEYEVTLGARDLGLQLRVVNPGAKPLGFTAALRSHIAVEDVRQPDVRVLGLQGSAVVDMAEPPGPPLTEAEPHLQIMGPTDLVFLGTQARLAVEVGTGCTVFVENTAGFCDHGVWNPWTSLEHYPNFLCVDAAVAGSPVQLPPACEWVGKCSLFVRDVVLG